MAEDVVLNLNDVLTEPYSTDGTVDDKVEEHNMQIEESVEDVITCKEIELCDAKKVSIHGEDVTETDGVIIIEEDDIVERPSNSYAAKKTVAQGMMDIALITANANQLRYLTELNSSSPTFYAVLVLIAISLSLQVAVGICLIFKGRLDVRGLSKNPQATKLNNYIVVGIFIITIANVFIASFTTINKNPEPRYNITKNKI